MTSSFVSEDEWGLKVNDVMTTLSKKINYNALQKPSKL